MNLIRRSFLLFFAIVPMACGTDSPSLNPSALGPAGGARLNATVGPATGHEHSHTPATVISIVSSAGPAGFLPNPLQAAVGSMVMWMNSDLVPHNIVLADGTPVGRMEPGEMTAPVTMATPSMAYYCTIHPTMTGVIADPSVVLPAPEMPVPPPMDYYPPDPGDGYYDY
jgi:plastocyanin